MPTDQTTAILFYLNVAFVFCVITEHVTLICIAKKTAYLAAVCRTAIMVHCVSVAAFIVQLVMYSCGNAHAAVAVCLALGTFAVAFITTSVYCFMLSRRSNAVRCIVAGVLNLVQPVGAIYLIILLVKLRRDNRAEQFVFTGYTYTYAVLESFVENLKLDYIDGATQGDFAELDKNALRAYLNDLRLKAIDPEGQFRYGEALAHYCPKRASLALQYIAAAARYEYPSALFNLGYIYEKGLLGFRPDMRKAREFYDRAAFCGDGDAALRLGVADIKRGKATLGYEVFKERIAAGDKCALYNVAFCLERGVGVTRDITEAIADYKLCQEVFASQKRLFALAAACITEGGKTKNSNPRPLVNDGIFDSVTDCEYDGDFKAIIDGLKKIKQGLAKESADIFLSAVKQRGKWEGVARCLVGALYLDCGALPADRANGAAYVKSALKLTPVAADVYATIPKSIINSTKIKNRA